MQVRNKKFFFVRMLIWYIRLFKMLFLFICTVSVQYSTVQYRDQRFWRQKLGSEKSKSFDKIHT